MFRRSCSTVKYFSQQSYAFGQVKCFCKFSLGAEVKNTAFVYPLECCAPYNPASTPASLLSSVMMVSYVLLISGISVETVYT